MNSNESIPLVSICLITYNHANFIRKAIEGIFEQETSFEWELIIADDFSTDGTREILEEYKQKYPERIKLILQMQNVGPAKNWLDLIRTPVGKYIAYFEGDDYWKDSQKIQKQVFFLEQNADFVACCGNAVYVKNGVEMKKVRNWEKVKTITTKDFLLGNDIITGTVLFRNQLSINFFKLLKNAYAGDWILYYYLSKKGNFYYSPDVLAAYRIHEGGAWNRLGFIEKLKHERNMKVILFKDNWSNGYSLILIKEIFKISGDIINIRLRKSIRNIFGNKMVDRVKQYKGS
jgi:glycosyltransferase involved in cell wall biosynthesis